MTALGNFLRRECSNRAQWHCSTMPADWCLSLGYPDFAAAWRGVSDPDECQAVPAAAGGLLKLWERGIGDGLPATDGNLAPGDIAVVAAFGHEAGAIWTGERWAMRAARAVHFFAAEDVSVLKAWRP